MTFKEIQEQITSLQLQFIQKVITDIWKEKVEDFNIESHSDWYFNLDDYCLNFTDFESIEYFNIPKSICFEFWDFESLNFETEKAKKFVSNFTNTSLKNFYFNYDRL